MPIGPSGLSGSAALSGVTVTGTAANGQVPVASSSSAGAWAYPPGFEIGYDAITAPVNIVGTTQGAATTVISCAAHTFDGNPVMLQVFCPELTLATVSGSAVGITLIESAAAITDVMFVRIDVAPTTKHFLFVNAHYRFTPTAGSHTYTIGAYTGSTTGTPSFGAGAGTGGATAPAFARFTKV